MSSVFARVDRRQNDAARALQLCVLLAIHAVVACSGQRRAGDDQPASPDSTVDIEASDTDLEVDTEVSGADAETDAFTGILGLPPLPGAPAAPPSHGVFMGATECAFCHTTAQGVMRDSGGEDISPNTRWQASMMALSGRDPYWLAQLAHELQERPEAEETVMDVCTRCHLPAGNVGARLEGRSLTYGEVVSGTDPLHQMAREGVTCTVCHQITDEGLGTPASYVGGYVIGDDRRIWGPHENPFTPPMINHLNYTPTASDHVMESSFCASCHTVITHAIGDDGREVEQAFPEQVPYLEWLNSTASRQGRSCQSCHASRLDREGNSFTTVLSIRPPSLNTQREVGDHGFIGGNAYMLELFADHREQTGAPPSEFALRAASERAEQFLLTTASIRLTAGSEPGEVAVTVLNHAGHKFPTAYPTRRAWLEVVFYNGDGEAVFHSGAFDEEGYIQASATERLDGSPVPHQQRIDDDARVQIYEGVMADISGAPTHTLLSGYAWWKDNRLLPEGWSATHEEAEVTAPVGVEGDEDFGAGGDTTLYVGPAGATRVQVRLWYQTLTPRSVDALHATPTPASVTLSEMTVRTPPIPRLVANAELELL